MAERRALIEGLDDIEVIDPDAAENFIYDNKPRRNAKSSTPVPKAPPPLRPESPSEPPAPRPTATAEAAAASPLTGVGRVPIGARVRTELAADLKRASLERQLQGIQPNSVQEILEDALELWLLKHGHRK